MKNSPRHDQWVADNPDRVRAYKRAWQAKNREKKNERARDYREMQSRNAEWKLKQCENTKASNARRKKACFAHYGNKCACCGESRIEFLSIDHINGGGTKFRQQNKGMAGVRMYGWLIKNDYPDGYRLLCHNCNQSMGYHGYCPHQRESCGRAATLHDFDTSMVVGL